MESVVEERGSAKSTGSAASALAPKQPLQTGEISTSVGKETDGRVVFARVRFDADLRKEFVASLKKYLEYLESTL